MPKVYRSFNNLNKLYISPRMHLCNKIALYSQIPNYSISPMGSPTQLYSLLECQMILWLFECCFILYLIISNCISIIINWLNFWELSKVSSKGNKYPRSQCFACINEQNCYLKVKMSCFTRISLIIVIILLLKAGIFF